MSDDIEWLTIVGGPKARPIGSVGIVAGKVAVITSLYDGCDGNMDGKVSWIEWGVCKVLSPLQLKNSGIATVAYAAARDYEVLMRDPEFQQEGERIWLSFVRGTVTEGTYAAWFQPGISGTTKAALSVTKYGAVKQFIIRKGMESEVKKVYKSQTGEEERGR